MSEGKSSWFSFWRAGRSWHGILDHLIYPYLPQKNLERLTNLHIKSTNSLDCLSRALYTRWKDKSNEYYRWHYCNIIIWCRGYPEGWLHPCKEVKDFLYIEWTFNIVLPAVGITSLDRIWVKFKLRRLIWNLFYHTPVEIVREIHALSVIAIRIHRKGILSLLVDFGKG